MTIAKNVILSTAAVVALGALSPATYAMELCDAQTSTMNAGATASTSDPLFGSPIDKTRLETQRGGQDLIVNDQKLKATVSENSASNLNTGNNIITEGALAGASGLPMVIQNSGNNVSIQNTTILNLNLK